MIRQLIERKQSEIRKIHPGLSCFNQGVRRIEIHDIPGISKCLCFLGMFNVMFNNLDWEFTLLSIFMIFYLVSRSVSGYYSKRKPVLWVERKIRDYILHFRNNSCQILLWFHIHSMDTHYTVVLNIGNDEINGYWILCASIHTLKCLLEKSQLKCISNTIITLYWYCIWQNVWGGKLSWFSWLFTQSQMFSHELWPCRLAM